MNPVILQYFWMPFWLAQRRRRMEAVMDIYEYMEGYDREFDENEFDARLWEAMNQPDFELDDTFEDYLHEYGIANTHEFLKMLRIKMRMGGI